MGGGNQMGSEGQGSWVMEGGMVKGLGWWGISSGGRG